MLEGRNNGCTHVSRLHAHAQHCASNARTRALSCRPWLPCMPPHPVHQARAGGLPACSSVLHAAHHVATLRDHHLREPLRGLNHRLCLFDSGRLGHSGRIRVWGEHGPERRVVNDLLQGQHQNPEVRAQPPLGPGWLLAMQRHAWLCGAASQAANGGACTLPGCKRPRAAACMCTQSSSGLTRPGPAQPLALWRASPARLPALACSKTTTNTWTNLATVYVDPRTNTSEWDLFGPAPAALKERGRLERPGRRLHLPARLGSAWSARPPALLPARSLRPGRPPLPSATCSCPLASGQPGRYSGVGGQDPVHRRGACDL